MRNGCAPYVATVFRRVERGHGIFEHVVVIDGG